MKIDKFDMVKLKTVKNVKYLSGPANRPATPKGVWIVCHTFADTTALLAKDETVIRIPIDDIVLLGKYNINTMLQKIKEVKSMADLKKVRGEINK